MSGRMTAARGEITRLMRKHGLAVERTEHSLRVADLALGISRLMTEDGLRLDMAVVEQGALLHDVGYLQCRGDLVEVPGWEIYGIRIPTDDINHPMAGAVVVEAWGFSDAVTDCVLRHNIGGFTVEECRLLGVRPIPRKDCAPVTWEEKAVHYADHLMLLRRLGLDALNDPEASAKACLPWLRYYFMERAGTRIGLDHATVQREAALSRQLGGYLRALALGHQDSWASLMG